MDMYLLTLLLFRVVKTKSTRLNRHTTTTAWTSLIRRHLVFFDVSKKKKNNSTRRIYFWMQKCLSQFKLSFPVNCNTIKAIVSRNTMCSTIIVNFYFHFNDMHISLNLVFRISFSIFPLLIPIVMIVLKSFSYSNTYAD